MNLIKNFSEFSFLNEKQKDEQEIIVIIKDDDDYKGIIKNATKYSAEYIKNSYQKENNLISIRFKIDKNLSQKFVDYLEEENVEDVITK